MKSFTYNDMAFSLEQAAERWNILCQRADGKSACVATGVFAGVPENEVGARALALVLLDNGGVALPPRDRAALERITYAPSLCGLFLMDGEMALPPSGAVQRPGAAISWLVDNRRKGISPRGMLTVHAERQASADRWAWQDGRVLSWMIQEIAPWQGVAVVEPVRLVRWPFAVPTTVHAARTLLSHPGAPLAFAGDAFDGPRVEGAVLSGWAAAEAVLTTLE